MSQHQVSRFVGNLIKSNKFILLKVMTNQLFLKQENAQTVNIYEKSEFIVFPYSQEKSIFVKRLGQSTLYLLSKIN